MRGFWDALIIISRAIIRIQCARGLLLLTGRLCYLIRDFKNARIIISVVPVNTDKGKEGADTALIIIPANTMSAQGHEEIKDKNCAHARNKCARD